MESIIVRVGSIDEVVRINEGIKEFVTHFSKEQFENTLALKKSLIAMALVDGQLAGYMICWVDPINRWAEIWSTGVAEKFRRKGVLRAMSNYTEDWVQLAGYSRIKSNVNNKRKEMLIARIKLGYSITGVELHENIDKCRIFFEKRL